MESKFEEFNLLIKEHDDTSGKDKVLDTINRAIHGARAPEPLRTQLQLNSQSYSTFPEMRQAITQHLKARKGFKLKEREDDPVDVDFVHKESPKGKGKGNDTGKGKSKGKGGGKGKHTEKGKSSGKGRSSQETARRDTKWSECWAKGGGAAKQAKSIGEREREKTGDVNWIMIQQPNDGQIITMGHEEWRCSGTSVSCKNAHKSHRASHAESEYVISNSSVAGSLPTQHSAFDHAHQLDTRPESVNPVFRSSTAKLVVDSGCFDHCCPLEFATQSKSKEGRFHVQCCACTVEMR